MSRHDDEIDLFLDELARGHDRPTELDAQSATAARRLFQRAARISPSENFVHRLEADLGRRVRASPISPVERFGSGVSRDRTVRRYAGRAFGAAALAVLAIVALTVIYRSGPDEPIFAVASVAASPSAFPSQVECDRDPIPALNVRGALSGTYGPALLKTILTVSRPAPEAPHLIVAIIPISELPSGVAPAVGVRAAVETAVRREIACRNFGLYGWRGYVGQGDSANPTPPVQPGATPIALTARLTPLPAPSNPPLTELPDGRVGVLLPTDLDGLGLEAYAIFAPYGDEWFMTEYVATEPDSWLASGYRGALVNDHVVVNLEDTYVWPTELAVPCCREVNLTIVNHSRNAHTIASTDRKISVSLAPGASKTLDVRFVSASNALTVDAGTRSQTPTGVHVWAIQNPATPAA